MAAAAAAAAAAGAPLLLLMVRVVAAVAGQQHKTSSSSFKLAACSEPYRTPDSLDEPQTFAASQLLVSFALEGLEGRRSS